MPRPFEPLTLAQFAERLRGFRFTRPVTAVHMHHSWRPRQADYAGARTIDAMWRHHTVANGWSDIAQHLSVAPDGTVWTGRDWNRTPASAAGYNAGAFMFETIGDFDAGREQLAGAQRAAVVDVIALVQRRLGLAPETLRFHRDFTTAKSCPGTGVVYAELLEEVRAAHARLGAAEPAGATLADDDPTDDAPTDDAPPLSRAASVYARGARPSRAPFAASELESAGAVAAAAARVDEADEGGPACDGDPARDDARRDGGEGAADGDDGGREAVRGGFRPAELALLRRHVINLRQGRFSGGGVMSTTAGDVDALFREHLPAAVAEARARGEPLRLLFYAHGGLVSEEAGLAMARDLVPWWRANGVYPVYFVWETGLGETLTQLLRGRRELAAARDLASVTDRALESVARAVGGGRLWDGMKYGAERASAEGGGARYAAERLVELCRAHAGAVEPHAVGHSAGSIFHAYFIPAALDAGAPAFATVSLLAPAVRVDVFLRQLAPRLAPGGGVGALTMYTMSKEYERADNCGRVYRKSLLYLVSRAFEAERGAGILGLEESVRADAAAAALFGLAGGAAGAHTVVWSRSAGSGSTTHGGFDNDRLTMEGVARRVLGAAPGARVHPFPASAARLVRLDLGGDGAVTDNAFIDGAGAADAPAAAPGRPPRPPVALPNGTAAGAPTVPGGGRLRRALCVGIDAYAGDARLAGCVADARLWARHFEAMGFEHVELILDGHATEAELRRALTELVLAGEPGDALVFQYAGHGAFFRDRGGDEGDGQDEALVPADFDRGAILLDDEQFRIFDRLADGVALTCFYDCCHSGTMARFALERVLRESRAPDAADDARARFIEPTPAMWAEYARRRVERRAREAGRRGVRDRDALKAVVFSACRDDEVALERGGQGVFTGRVAPLVAAAHAAGTSNAAFMRQITKAFGARPSQHPGLDCAPAAEGRPLLRAAVAAPATPGRTGRRAAGPAAAAAPAPHESAALGGR